MEKGMYVKDIIAGGTVEGVFAIASASKGATKDGQPYWLLTLSDRTGSMEGRIWAPESHKFKHIVEGTLASISGNASVFREKLQIAIKRFEQLNELASENMPKGDFVAASPRDPDDMLQELLALCWREFHHRPWLDFMLSVLDDPDIRQKLKVAPAAKSIHQAYAGGLLEHTLSVASLCLAISDLYPRLDRQTLLAGAILHDLGKIHEYTCGVVNEYSQAGKLLGHIILGLELISPYLAASKLAEPLREHLRHLIVSHHGELEYGSPKLPQTAEAFALHYADNLNAKLALCDAQFESDSAAPVWSQRIFALERAVLLPERTPADFQDDVLGTEIPKYNCADFPDITDCGIGAEDPVYRGNEQRHLWKHVKP